MEGLEASAAMRDVELTLEYDETPAGSPQDRQHLFKCEDRIRLTVVAIAVSEIGFNYKKGSANDDALNIRMSYSEDIPLPEYVRGNCNRPAAYVRDSSVKIAVKLSISPQSISSAKIWGESADVNGSLGDTLETMVPFDAGVSKGVSLDGGAGDFIEFSILGRTPVCQIESAPDRKSGGF